MSERPDNLPHGRWLGDFPDLSALEKRLVADCARGEACAVEGFDWDNPARPAETTVANTIHAELIRFLLLGGDALHPAHELGVIIGGAWISGELNLRHGQCDRRLDLRHCCFDTKPTFVASTLPELMLAGCALPGLSADRMAVSGSVFLNKGFFASGTVHLIGAQIGGQLNCDGGRFTNVDADGKPIGDALSADNMMVKGNVFLNKGFSASGTVSMHSAQIGGSLVCDGGSFAATLNADSKPVGNALSADHMVVKGSVSLRDGFSASGEVRLLRAQIDGNLSCSGGSFTNVDAAKTPIVYALTAEGMVVKGSVFFYAIQRSTARSAWLVRAVTG